MNRVQLWWHRLWHPTHRHWEVNTLIKSVREGGRWERTYRCECQMEAR